MLDFDCLRQLFVDGCDRSGGSFEPSAPRRLALAAQGGLQLANIRTAARSTLAVAIVAMAIGCDRAEPGDSDRAGPTPHTEERAPAASGAPQVKPASPVAIAPTLQQAAQLCARGDFETARTLATRHAADHPEDGMAEFVIALTYHEAGNHGPAVAHFQRSIELTPEHVRTHLYFGECLFMLGDLPGARREYEALRQAQPQDPEGVYRIGLVDLEEAQLDEAEASFRAAIEIFGRMAQADPRQFAARRSTAARCHARLADVHFARDDYQAARAELIAATTIEPRNISAFFTLSQVYRRLGRDDLAEQALERYETARQKIIEGQQGGGG